MSKVDKKHTPRVNQSGSKGKFSLMEAPTLSNELGFKASWINPVGHEDPVVMTAKIVSFAGY